MDLPRDLVLPDVLASAVGLRAAIVVIDGLSVCCFNKTGSDKFWEVAYPREQHHELRIKIWELDAADKPVGTHPIHNVVLNAGVVRLNISLTNGSVAHHAQFPAGGPRMPDFERLDPEADPHDLGWLIDLAGSELKHNFRRLLPRSSRRSRVSLARIFHSLFCTLKPEDHPVVISPRHRNNPRHPDRCILGRNNTEFVGVLQATQAGDVRLVSEPAGLLDLRLPHDQNKRYRIEIINTDTQPAQRVKPFVKGDLHLFYDDVIEVNGEQKELWAIPPKDGRFAPDGDCHTNGFGGATLEELLGTEP
jgi:hypothetical protein